MGMGAAGPAPQGPRSSAGQRPADPHPLPSLGATQTPPGPASQSRPLPPLLPPGSQQASSIRGMFCFLRKLLRMIIILLAGKFSGEKK